MQHSIRSVCVFLCIALLAVTSIHGVSDTQHTVAHASDWPALALADHDGATGNQLDHIHVAADDLSEEAPTGEIDGDGPLGHSHHIGGDSHPALPGAEYPMNDGSSSNVARGHGLDSALGDMTRDGPEHPPKRMRTVV